MKLPKWTIRSLAVGVALVLAARAGAQQPQPQIKPGGAVQPQPKVEQPKAEPKAKPAEKPKAPAIVVYPQLNSWPGIPASLVNPPAFNPGPFFNPALNNPWMNQVRVVPTNPYVNNPFTTPFVNQNPFVNNPFNQNPFVNQFNNPFAPNQFGPIGCFGPGGCVMPGPFTPITSTPPIAFQMPGQLLWRGPDLQVNPTTGFVYKPLSGVARTADGSVFFRVPGSGLPTVTGAYATGSGLYYNPQGGTFLNPSSGVISRPGVTNVFIPWMY